MLFKFEKLQILTQLLTLRFCLSLSLFIYDVWRMVRKMVPRVKDDSSLARKIPFLLSSKGA